MIYSMEWLNYHHLLYFWTVAREGGAAAAARKLGISQPTVSAQIRALERSLGHRLFERAGRGLVLTEMGRNVLQYADEIFTLGHDLLDMVRGRPVGRPLRFVVGVADTMPKLLVRRLLAPAMRLDEPIQLVCLEGKPADLMARLALHELDVVLSDGPATPAVGSRAFNHLLGESAVGVFAEPRAAERYRKGFPRSLDGAPFLLPTANTMLRRAMDLWFEQHDLRPMIVGEFEDSALLKVFGQSGSGLFPAPEVMAEQIQTNYDVRGVGQLDGVREQFYAVSMERQVKHPAVKAITQGARDWSRRRT